MITGLIIEKEEFTLMEITMKFHILFIIFQTIWFFLVLSVLEEKESTHNFKNLPTLKSKLLFMDYRFDNFLPGTLYCTDSNIVNFRSSESKNPIIKFGRETIGANDVKVPGGTSISRRHCLIVNCKNDMWLYDLKSTGTYVNKKKVEKKAHLIGKNAISIGSIYYEMTDDKNSLF